MNPNHPIERVEPWMPTDRVTICALPVTEAP
ncbi:hypothetical protein P3T43_006701 [Paraburkholderia sp. GAS41]